MSIYTSGEWRVKAGREEEFVRTWSEFAQASTQELGDFGQALLLRDQQDKSHFISFGEWKDMATIEQWRQSPGYQEQVARVEALTESWEIKPYDVASVHRPLQAVR